MKVALTEIDKEDKAAYNRVHYDKSNLELEKEFEQVLDDNDDEFEDDILFTEDF